MPLDDKAEEEQKHLPLPNQQSMVTSSRPRERQRTFHDALRESTEPWCKHDPVPEPKVEHPAASASSHQMEAALIRPIGSWNGEIMDAQTRFQHHPLINEDRARYLPGGTGRW